MIKDNQLPNLKFNGDIYSLYSIKDTYYMHIYILQINAVIIEGFSAFYV